MPRGALKVAIDGSLGRQAAMTGTGYRAMTLSRVTIVRPSTIAWATSSGSPPPGGRTLVLERSRRFEPALHSLVPIAFDVVLDALDLQLLLGRRRVSLRRCLRPATTEHRP